MRRRGSALVVLAAAAAVPGLWSLYTTNADFPLGFHSDEPKKVQFALSQEHDFHHPLLMVQAMRLAREVLAIDTPEAMVVAGRRLSAAYMLIGVGLSLVLFLRLLGPVWAWAAAAALAVTPLVSVHAHYIKEDAVFFPAVVAALLALIRYAERPERGAAMLGVAMGIALAAQYKALLLVALAYALPALGVVPRSSDYFRGLRRASWIALGIFVLVCYPLLLSATTFGGGFTNQVGHVIGGHYVKIYAIPELFTYHLRESLVPGLTPALLALAAGGVLWATGSWRRLDVAWRIALLYLGAFYLSAELSPSKPPPDFMRYMIPAAPIVVAVAFRLLRELGALQARWAAVLSVVVLVLTLRASLLVVDQLGTDTRFEAAELIAELEAGGARVAIESYAGLVRADLFHTDLGGPAELRSRGFTHLAVSSFALDRYVEGARRAYQRPAVYEMARHAQELLALPHTEIRPQHPSFAYSNPTIWLVDLRQRSRP